MECSLSMELLLECKVVSLSPVNNLSRSNKIRTNRLYTTVKVIHQQKISLSFNNLNLSIRLRANTHTHNLNDEAKAMNKFLLNLLLVPGSSLSKFIINLSLQIFLVKK